MRELLYPISMRGSIAYTFGFRYAGWIGTVAAASASSASSASGPEQPKRVPTIEEANTRLAAIAGTSTCHIVQSKEGILVPG